MRLGSASLLAPVSNCGDRHESCARYASEGRCRQLPEAYCPAACGLCADAAAAAAEDPCRPVPDAVGPGAVAAAFARAAALERIQPTLASTDPPVIIFDAFASAEEAERLATLAESVSFRSSGSSCGQKEVCSSASLSCVPVPGGDCWSEGAMRGLEARMLEALRSPPATASRSASSATQRASRLGSTTTQGRRCLVTAPEGRACGRSTSFSARPRKAASFPCPP